MHEDIITEISHGCEVISDQVAVSGFLREAIEKAGGNRKFTGTLDELEDLTMAHMANWKPGMGAVDGDVRIVELPTAGFLTDIVAITPENSHRLEVTYAARRDGEEPVPQFFLRGIEPVEAATVGIVIYRADVLDRDSDRSSLAEWEIVAILADPALPEGKSVPMHPATMARNAAHLEGGTFREYSAEQWLEAVLFWQRHAKAVPELSPTRSEQITDLLYGGEFANYYIPEYQADAISEAAQFIEDLFRRPAGTPEIS